MSSREQSRKITPRIATSIALACACLCPALLARAQRNEPPPYSIGVPSLDEIPADVIPPAPPPVKRPPPKPAPVAQSPQEQAAFESIGKEQRPDERIRLVEDFLLAYPDSEFKQAVYLAAADAYRRKNDLPRMLTYSELVLAENPENLQALLTLAQALPESVHREDPDYLDRVEEAQDYARQAISLIAKTPRPAGASVEQWQATRRQVELAARLALALTEMMREDYAAAEREYTLAFKLTDKPDAVSLYRLGIAYTALKKYEEAAGVLEKAAAAGGVTTRSEAGASRDLVAEALQFVQKQLAGTSSSGDAEPAPSAPPEPPAAVGSDGATQ